MTLNATLLIQILNFGVAYFLIRVLFLKPSVKLIEKEDQEENLLIEKLQSVERIAQAKEEDLADIWHKAQKKFEKNSPAVEYGPSLAFVDAIKEPDISDKQIKEISMFLQDFLVEEVMKNG